MWEIYNRGTVELHRLSIPMLAVRDVSKKLIGRPNDKILYCNIGNKLWWAWDKKQIAETGQHVLKIIKNKKGADKHFRYSQDISDRAIEASELILGFDLKNLAEDKLVDVYKFLYKETKEAHGFINPVIDAIDVVFDSFLANKIKNELQGRDFDKVYKKLSLPVYQSYISKQEIAIIKVALKKKITKTDIDNLYKNFWWVKLGWENIVPYTRAYFDKQVKKYKKYKDLNKRLASLQKQVKQLKKDRALLIREYKLSKDIVYWLEILDKYTQLHDFRKEMQVRTMYAGYILLKAVARRLKLNHKDLEWLWHHEVDGLLRGKKFDKAEVARRKKAICVVITKANVITYSGQRALASFRKYIPQNNKQVQEIRGTATTKGKVIARVKVCSGAEEAMKKIKKGDILVCGMTLPDYVPAMRRAVAIITDEGGITCHAAIISRELNIPCIVGTRIATQVLKDGDKVEVDANTGIVRKI